MVSQSTQSTVSIKFNTQTGDDKRNISGGLRAEQNGSTT